MGVYLDETLADLRALLQDMQASAHETAYGYFPGGDPRSFTPDIEVCSGDEVKRWQDDCARAERGDPPLVPIGCHNRMPGYGLGTYTMSDDAALDWSERLERAILQIERLDRES